MNVSDGDQFEPGFLTITPNNRIRAVVDGIHTPEFGFEKSADAVQAAIKRHGIRHQVAQDNEYATWNAYHNQYWPARYIIDRSAMIVFEHAGEGQYQEMERKIQELLNVNS